VRRGVCAVSLAHSCSFFVLLVARVGGAVLRGTEQGSVRGRSTCRRRARRARRRTPPSCCCPCRTAPSARRTTQSRRLADTGRGGVRAMAIRAGLQRETLTQRGVAHLLVHFFHNLLLPSLISAAPQASPAEPPRHRPARRPGSTQNLSVVQRTHRGRETASVRHGSSARAHEPYGNKVQGHCECDADRPTGPFPSSLPGQPSLPSRLLRGAMLARSSPRGAHSSEPIIRRPATALTSGTLKRRTPAHRPSSQIRLDFHNLRSHGRPYVGASRPRSWSHLLVLGAISWVFIAKS